MSKKLTVTAALVLMMLGLLGSSACPPSRPTTTVNVCLTSGMLAGDFCPTDVVAMRTYYQSPAAGEPVAPAEICDVHQAPPETVTLDICTVSGLLPGDNCTSIVRKTYVAGQQPTMICQVCRAPVIYPAKSKRPFWVFVPELLTASGDRPAFLKRAREAGAWGVRVFLMQSWSTVNVYPYKQAVYNGQRVILDVKSEGWKSIVRDLAQPNPEYYAALNKLLDELEDYDLGLIATIEDDCSVRNDRIQRHNYPLMGSLQTLSAEEDWPFLVPAGAKAVCEYSPGGLYSTYRYKWHQAWVSKIIPVLRARTTIPLWIELDNEFSRNGWPTTAKEPGAWYSMMEAAIVAAGIPKERIVHSCVAADFDIVKANIGSGIYSQHGVVLPSPSIGHISAALLAKTMLSGDGGFNGHSTTDIDSFGKKGISAADAVALAQFIKAKGLLGYEWMPRIAWRDDDCLANLDRVMDWSVPKAMIAELNK